MLGICLISCLAVGVEPSKARTHYAVRVSLPRQGFPILEHRHHVVYEPRRPLAPRCLIDIESQRQLSPHGVHDAVTGEGFRQGFTLLLGMA
jgi:hypothetical protein